MKRQIDISEVLDALKRDETVCVLAFAKGRPEYSVELVPAYNGMVEVEGERVRPEHVFAIFPAAVPLGEWEFILVEDDGEL